jgi:hypothetical protein
VPAFDPADDAKDCAATDEMIESAQGSRQQNGLETF